jgi:hypothetical protein
MLVLKKISFPSNFFEKQLLKATLTSKANVASTGSSDAG